MGRRRITIECPPGISIIAFSFHRLKEMDKDGSLFTFHGILSERYIAKQKKKSTAPTKEF